MDIDYSGLLVDHVEYEVGDKMKVNVFQGETTVVPPLYDESKQNKLRDSFFTFMRDGKPILVIAEFSLAAIIFKE